MDKVDKVIFPINSVSENIFLSMICSDKFIVLFNNEQLNIFGDKEWNDQSINVFIEYITEAEKRFDSIVDLIVNKNENYSIYYLFDEVNILFNHARLLKSYIEIKDRYLFLIKRYLLYVNYITYEEYMFLMENENNLMNECFNNIPYIKNYMNIISRESINDDKSINLFEQCIDKELFSEINKKEN